VTHPAAAMPNVNSCRFAPGIPVFRYSGVLTLTPARHRLPKQVRVRTERLTPGVRSNRASAACRSPVGFKSVADALRPRTLLYHTCWEPGGECGRRCRIGAPRGGGTACLFHR